ncbi:hypothetical protein PFICI_06683 [Pestalotiopsis fici W106-1]|uniref:Transcription factor domain-containing protein n=1 Tax=Pestalotiopsis fici (strain W106-1 / CGMCC3.15140) TaxID=1229662 RepID=W3X935_PESFW|nr:uncharacterized protein PFICI_06683 [Pestalotiopsis fici W106-1]ETS81681.1 hypothetical protein PFICI_06683 [Pestalotiopsis fici W106-1]
MAESNVAKESSVFRNPGSPALDIFPNVRNSFYNSIDKKTLDKLVVHWENNIASRMVWVDSDKNPYRMFVAPLAYTVPVVGLAMAAVSSQHASSPAGYEELSRKARDEAIDMISAYVKNITSHVLAGHDVGMQLNEQSVERMLAAMLLLSCYEMTDSGSSAADFHRRAARSLVNTFETTRHKRSALFEFLRNQLSIHDVMACTTSFQRSTMKDVILPSPKDQSVLFSSFLTYLYDVTLLSSELPSSRARSVRLGLSLRHIQTQFEVARGETLMACGRLMIEPASRRRDFICVVNIMHYAAMLYAARCLDLGSPQICSGYLDSLFDQIAAMSVAKDWLHCIAWAVFVAGTECHGDGRRQAIIAELYDQLCENMRFRNFHDAMHFLRDFWNGTDADWRWLARDWESSGHGVLLS